MVLDGRTIDRMYRIEVFYFQTGLEPPVIPKLLQIAISGQVLGKSKFSRAHFFPFSIGKRLLCRSVEKGQW